MKILFLAPQPFFEDRGTPIAVRLALQSLSSRGDTEIDLLAYHEGRSVEIPGVTIHRIPGLGWLRGIGPGISFKKILCDVIFTLTALRMVWRTRKTRYDLIHAVEESVFVAWAIKKLFGIPYIYDMDSSLALQLTETWKVLGPLYPVMKRLEEWAIRGSTAVVPVCDALAAIADRSGSAYTKIIRDISLLNPERSARSSVELRAEVGADESDALVVYIGNLEGYQGIDLLIESFARVAREVQRARLVVVGGRQNHIARYSRKAEALGISARAHFIGPRPLDDIDAYTLQADILVSPRIRGNNTPMKIYSYLHSGRAIVATDLPTHTQVMTSAMAELAAPEPAAFAAAIVRLISDPARRAELGSAAKRHAESNYTFEVFDRSLKELYDSVRDRLANGIPVAPRVGNL